MYSITKCFEKSRIPNLLRVFSLASDREDILQVREKILLLLVGGKREKTLDKLHLHIRQI